MTTTTAVVTGAAAYPFWLGGISATFAASITHPLDLTKVRLQAMGDKGMVASIRRTVGLAGIRGLFDGISATWMRQLSYSICRFWAYDQSKELLGATEKNAPIWKLTLAGGMAGAAAGLVGNPAEIVIVRMQGDLARPPAKRFNYKNSVDSLFRIIREEGLSSVTRGLGPNVFRSVVANSTQLASYDFFKSRLMKTAYFEDNMALHFTAGFGSGTVATVICSPADVLKNRIMSASGQGSNSALAVIRNAMRQEGPMFMFKGLLPAFLRVQPYTILIFLTLEQLKGFTDFTRRKGFTFL
ncbi:hypothetical protein D9619_011715 [Psilocybe cf. subviscida]|uniref:Mitochondrial dicarboxylate transporter n=1 Tax=Psilocybe cf. subviscida TaxID=2480587 RepID=A0A8H5F9R7_9AGAR|nr:hypothetical protein D9619_011715 [Psilocybe cf. subviscida]